MAALTIVPMAARPDRSQPPCSRFHRSPRRIVAVIRARLLAIPVKHLTDRLSNPFGMRPPFDRSDERDVPAVFGYGDPNGDFHVIGDHPGVHGGSRSGIPFSDRTAVAPLRDLLRSVELLTGPSDDPQLENCFCNYVHMCTLPGGRVPTDREYARLERFFDAELRAVNAHVLLPVGKTATDRVLREYTTQRSRVALDMTELHATELRGRGFLVVPLADPGTWDGDSFEAARSRLESILASDYRQTKGVATTVG